MLRLAFQFCVISLSLSACTDKTFPGLETLEISPFREGGPELFTITGTSQQQNGGPMFRSITISFESVYDQLTEDQQTRINGIRIVAPSYVSLLDVDATEWTDVSRRTVGRTWCYELQFYTAGNQLTRGTEVCVLAM